MKRYYIIILLAIIFSFLIIRKIIYIHSSKEITLGDVSSIKIGDVNGDGSVNSKDYILVKKYVLHLKQLTDNQKMAADVNGDGIINIKDYIQIKKSIITQKPLTLAVKNITLNQNTLSLDGGDTFNLAVNINPPNATEKTITWTSSNPRVATVDGNGRVIANVSGTSTITATSSNGKTATCEISVTVNIDYHEIRYTDGDNSGTSIWYAIIPPKYKMHFAYGNDVICEAERPSDVAKRVNATIAVNSQLLGFPVNFNGQQVYCNQNVRGYDFTIKQNPNFSMNNINTSPCDALIVTATTDFSQGISFKDINLGFEYEGDHVKCYGGNYFMTLFAQLIMNGSYPDRFNPVPMGTDYYNKYYTQQETRQHERIPRTWIAYDSVGNQFVATAMGRNYPLKDGREIGQAGLTYHEMINVTKKYFGNDIVTMYNMDGGGSATFVYKGEKLNGNGDIDSNGNRYERILWGTLYW